ncbi:chorismate mutase [Novosphingobium sp. G106]|uniref:chorismate mutase n=1 Tax=Novosphingobium sp. G106 TaxID=2849500 RepID=UPI001C2D497B|nr:chorismate mutase [Novosphingobium sp. G106]MBV1687400.1 chorismate mutase [Novosphingobium sp. G106]
MPEQPLAPEDCQTMLDVRAGVDALDAELINLLARRFGYMRAAARIKPNRDAVRDEPRKAEVIGNAVALAQAEGLPTELIGRLWEQLVEGCIAYELGEWDSARGA